MKKKELKTNKVEGPRVAMECQPEVLTRQLTGAIQVTRTFQLVRMEVASRLEIRKMR